MSRTERRSFLKGALGASGLLLAPGGTALAAANGNDEWAAILDAVVRGEVARVDEWLTRSPALVNARDAEGRSVFALALLHRHASIADRVLAAGYAPDVHEAALALDWERFAELASAAPGAVNLNHPIGGSAMVAAAVGGAGLQIWRVYAQGGEPDAAPRGARYVSGVRAAFEHPDLATAELTAATLLGNGADPNATGHDGRTPLHAAAARASAPIVETLIRKGAKVDARDREGLRPRDLVPLSGAKAVLRLLDDPDVVPRETASSRKAYDVRGNPYTPPDLAVFATGERARVVGVAHHDLESIRDALARHPELAHAEATTTEGAIEAAAHMGRPDIAQVLLEAGAPYAIPTAVMHDDRATVTRLLDEDPARINERGAHDFALLWYPVIGGGHVEMMELLLSRGADVETHHWLGTTALHYAAMGGQVEIAELLIAHGADVSRAGRKFGGRPLTPLQLAKQRDHAKLVALLESKGARG